MKITDLDILKKIAKKLHIRINKRHYKVFNQTSIIYLNLRYMKIKNLPVEIGNLQSLQKLDLSNNPLKKPPLNIANQGIDAIRNYFKELKEQGAEFVYEAKLILVGEPGAGKTSLSKKLLDPKYKLDPKEPMTQGILIEKWNFFYKEKIPFTINIWDFGGQEIMHSTHKYFLTRRSLYIVLADNRKEDTDFYYWLHMVELLGGKSPVFIVLNEKFNYKKYVPTDILETFNSVLNTFKIDLADNTGLTDLSNKIKQAITLLPHVEKEPIPKKWVKVRNVLESLEKDYISLEEYIDICDKQGIRDEEKAFFISAFLHDIGVILHF